MSCKDITSQTELDEALVDADVTCVHIKSPNGVWLDLADNHGKAVEASDSASVRASGSASVRASGSASVSAFDSASVSAFDSASVRAFDSASVSASSHVAVHKHSGYATIGGGVVIDVSDLDLEDTATWLDHHGIEVADGRAVLYKALPEDLTAGRDYDRPTVYTVGVDLVAEDWRDDHDCGGGLHLSPSPIHAEKYQTNAQRYLRCTAAVEDIRAIDDKVKVRALRVEAEVDAFARDIVSTLDGGQ